MDRQQITSAARKALIAANPNYYTWPASQQERFRATMDKASRNKVQRVLLESLFGIECTDDQADHAWDNAPLANVNDLNWASLLTRGVGDDYIYLNECMAEGKSLLDFPTLYDYDYEDYLFQEQANKRDFPAHTGSDYFAFKHQSWVRLLISDQFYYATFLSLSTYHLSEVESAGNDYINQLIPHEYVDGNNHGKREKGGYLWDLQVDACGNEAQLDELNSRWYHYQRQRWVELSETNAGLSPCVFTQDQYWDDDPHRYFIFCNAETLKAIQWRHFLTDCETLIADYSSAENQLIQEIDRAKTWLTQEHRDIVNNFDPNVVKLRKKRMIIMTPEALEDLNRIDDEG